MKKRYWIFSLFLLTVVFAVEYDLARRIDSKMIADQKKSGRPEVVVALPTAPIQENNSGITSILDSKFILAHILLL